MNPEINLMLKVERDIKDQRMWRQPAEETWNYLQPVANRRSIFSFLKKSSKATVSKSAHYPECSTTIACVVQPAP